MLDFNNITKEDASKVDSFYDEIDKTNMTESQYQDLIDKINSLKEDLKDGVLLSDSSYKRLMKYIVAHDITTIREYIKTNSSICFQKDFFIDPIEKFIYKSSFNTELKDQNINIFNNDSAFLEFNQDMILVTCAETTLYDNNYNYFIDVFVNGKLLSRDQYYERPSNIEYNFVGFHTGARRIFIKRIATDSNDKFIYQEYENGNKEYVQNVKTGDIVSVVVHKCPSIENSFYTTVSVTNNENNTINFTILTEKLCGSYNNISNANIIIYKKVNDNYIPINNDNYYIQKGENNYTLFSLYDKDIKVGDELLIINKSNYLEGTFISDKYDSIEDYIKDGLKNCRIKPFIKVNDIEKFPIPFTCDEELEIYVNGLRLVPKVDYFSVVDENEGLYIQLTGLLKSESKVMIRNKCFAFIQSKNTDIDSISSKKDHLTSLYHIDNKLTYKGFIWMEQYPFPIHPGYIEAYVGRHRIPFIYKRYVCNKCLKIDRQIYEKHLETYTEILWNDLLLDYTLQEDITSLDPADNLYSFDKNLVTSGWLYKKDNDLDTTKDEGSDYNTLPNFYSVNHPLKPNILSDLEDNPFNGNFIGIILSAEPTLLKESEDPVFKLLMEISLNDELYYIDITKELKDYITINGFNRDIIGKEQTVTANLLINNSNGDEVYNYSNSVLMKILPKEIVLFDLYPQSNFFMSNEGKMYKTVDMGDKILEMMDVIVRFEDGSEKVLKASNGTITVDKNDSNKGILEIIDSDNLKATVTGPILANEKIGYERIYLTVTYYNEEFELHDERYVMLTTHKYISESNE